ncbi:MAG: hypothetical protein D6707_01105 [Bacteroidetes bacterium]|nr:MAG: hypothetical protein D6707_01105 [Bacteroidota bacterium]
MEIFWWVMTVITAIFSIYAIQKTGFEDGALYLFMPAACTAMAYLRRFMRKKIERNQDQTEK